MATIKVNNIDVPCGIVYEGVGTILKIYKNKVDIAVNPDVTGNPIQTVEINQNQKSLIKIGQKINYSFVFE